eukprot:15333618-Ditylum_brightwellii.AAC.1
MSFNSCHVRVGARNNSILKVFSKGKRVDVNLVEISKKKAIKEGVIKVTIKGLFKFVKDA